MDDLGALIALAARLIPDPLGWPQQDHPTTLRPAALPPDLPLDLPLPAEGRLIGSSTCGTRSLMILDSPESPQRILSFYQRELEARGWYRHDWREESGFLQPGEPASFMTLYCRDPHGPPLWIKATVRPPPRTEVRIELDSNLQQTPCAEPSSSRQRPIRRSQDGPSLPTLVAPPGAIIRQSGESPGIGAYRATATIETDLDLGRIVDHVTHLLDEADWKQRLAGAADSIAWSTWTCLNETGEEVQGSFLAFERSTRVYVLQVERDLSRQVREKADVEVRERAGIMRRALHGEYAARVELQGHPGGAEIEALRQLILRIAVPPIPSNPDHIDPQLLPGRLPDSLPAELPPSSRVLGTVEIGSRTAIYLETRIPPRQILSFYQHRLSAPDWIFFGEERRTGGFTVSDLPDSVSCLFCPGTTGPAIELRACARPGGMTHLLLTLLRNLRQTPCVDPSHPARWIYHDRRPQLPLLAAPRGVTFVAGGGGGGQIEWESTGYLYSDADIPWIASHYGRQFEAEVWTRESEEQDAVVAWSTWTRQDEVGEPVDALFLAVRYPDSSRYFLLARASRRIGAVK